MSRQMELAKKYSPKWTAVDVEAVASCGNGHFCFNVDVTGFQTLFEEYLEKNNPLCTMSDWAWHETPNQKGGKYRFEDLEFDVYPYEKRTVHYPVHPKPGNEEVYEWLRKNPHRANLARFQLVVEGTKEKKIQRTEIKEITQTLRIDEGIVYSNYKVLEEMYEVETFVDPKADRICCRIKSEAFRRKKARIEICLPYPTSTISGGDFSKTFGHESKREGDQITHRCDAFHCFLTFDSENCALRTLEKHCFEIHANAEAEWFEFSVAFADKPQEGTTKTVQEVKRNAKNHWRNFWETGDCFDLEQLADPKLFELQRRLTLSMYQLALHSSGNLPPQETGLVCNSWYGKFHLEMIFWHTAWALETGRTSLVLPQLLWYKSRLEQARENAQRNGFKGVRWPKMIGPNAVDSPSFIAVLLVWQQTHIVYLLDLAKKNQATELQQDFIKGNWAVIEGTIDFSCDFLHFDPKKNQYDMIAPVIPSQEAFEPMSVKNPTFEMAYWKFCIGLALEWAEKMRINKPLWQEVYEKIAVPKPSKEGLYLSHELAEDTFSNYMQDHPTQLAIYGLFDNPDAQKQALRKTLQKVLDDWDEQSMWGWDYGYMAMLAESLGEHALAVEILLKNSPKNYYAKNGHNYQQKRKDLPVYLPGNGSLVLAVRKIFQQCKINTNSKGGKKSEE